MPNNNKNQKRGYKGPMRRATKQVQKALALAEKRRKQAAGGYRKPPKGRDRVPNYPSRDTNQIDHSTSPTEHQFLSTADFRGLGAMSIPGAALAGGFGASALANKTFSDKRGAGNSNPNPGIDPDRSGPPGRYLPPPKQTEVGSRRDKQGGNSGANTDRTIEVRAPVIIGVEKHGAHPKMWAKSRSGDVEVVVEHTEYVEDVKALGTAVWPDSALQFFANPGQNRLFPWLSTLANNFDEYKFDYLELCFEPLLGSSTQGKILITFDPDVLDDFPDSKAEMLEAKVQLDAPVWTRSGIKVPKDLLNQWLFVRPGSVPVGADQHNYDAGVFNLCPTAISTGFNNSVGELFIRYRARLRTPNGGQIRAGRYDVSGMIPANPLGTDLKPTTYSNLPVVRTGNSTFQIQTPGAYLVDVIASGTTFGSSATLATTAPNTATLLNTINTAAISISSYVVNVVDPNVNITMTAPTGAGTLTGVLFRITQYDVDMT